MAPLNWAMLNGLKLPSRVSEALKGMSSDVLEEAVRGFEQLASATKRTEDVAMNLDKLLAAGIVPAVLSYLKEDVMERFPNHSGNREAAMEALHVAACAALGELVWTRDCAPEVRPVVLQEGGMGALSELIHATPSERLRLKALMVCRRMLYEVGSTGRMDTDAIQAASECNLVECLMGLLMRVVDSDAHGVTIDTLEGVTYLLQRMMVCLEPNEKEKLNLAEYLESVATVMVKHLHEAANSGSDLPETQTAIRASLLAIRELVWDDHNTIIEPGLSAMAAAGAFEAVAGLMSPIHLVAEGAKSQISIEAKKASDAPPPLARGLLRGGTTDLACALLDKLAAVPEAELPEKLAALVPRMMHSVIVALVAQLDGKYAPGDGVGGHDDVAARQERALSALRKLLVIENSEFVPPAAVEAADAEGVPACLRKLALSCPEFVGGSASISATVGVSGSLEDRTGSEDAEEQQRQVSCSFPTAVTAAALLADLTASSALAAAANGQPAQAAAELREVEAVVVPLISHADTDQSVCRNFCFALYQLSLVHYADKAADDGEQDEEASTDADPIGPKTAESLAAPGAVARAAAQCPAPPDEEQYALSSELVTLVGRVADGLNGLLAGGGCGEVRHPPNKPPSQPRSPQASVHHRSQSSETVFSGGGEQDGISVLSRLQRVTQLIHELVGLRPALGSSPVSKHNLDAMFVHGTMQGLLQQMDVYYTGLRAWLKARKEAREARQRAENAEKAEALEKGLAPPEEDRVVPERPITAYLEKPPPSTLLALLHHETGVLELFKELVRDVPDARIRLRDIGALPSFARMLNDNRRDNLLVSLQFNLARSEAIHIALKQAGCVALMEGVLMEPPCGDGAQYDVRQLLALCTLGLVAGEDVASRFSRANSSASPLKDSSLVVPPSVGVGEGGSGGSPLKGKLKDGNKQAATAAERDAWAIRAVGLLESFDMADLMKRVMWDACRDGKYVISSSTSAWPFLLEPAALTVQFLARCNAMARRLDENKIPELLISALGNKHGREPEPELCIARALLNFARLPDLRPKLLAAGCVDALEPLVDSENICTVDAAKGCLLYLGELPDAAARSALQGSTPEALAPVLQAPLPRPSDAGEGEGAVRPSLSGAPAGRALGGDEEAQRLNTFMSRRGAAVSRKGSSVEAALAAISSSGSTEPVVDVLISYRRRDALTFAFMLHTALVLRGVGCLLDYEYKPDLSDVEQVVARCRTLLLVLTDNVLNSERCLRELEAAARHSVNVVIVVKEGARWGDASGNMLTFPPAQTVRALKPSVQTIFALKAVHHREEHYGYFVTQLMKRLKRVQPTLPSSKSTRARASMTGQSLFLKIDPAFSPAPSMPSPVDAAQAPLRKQKPAATLGGAAEAHAHTSPTPKHISLPALPAGSSGEGGLSAASFAHMATLDGISAEVAALRQMVALNAGQQQAIQALQADIALVRREVVAEVAASSRQLAASIASEMATLGQQVRGTVSSEAAGHANTLALLKADITSAVNVATAAMRTELGQEMGLNIRHLAADLAELRQGMQQLMNQQQLGSTGNLTVTGMPHLQSTGHNPASTYPPRQHHTLMPRSSVDVAQLQPHPPPHPPPYDASVTPFGPHTYHERTSGGQDANHGLGNGASPSGSLLPPISVSGASANGTVSPPQQQPPQQQGRMTAPKVGVNAAGSRELPHTVLGNTGNLTSVGSMTPNVGGFAGPRLLAAQQQQYQQQRAMAAHAMAARSKAGPH